MATHQKYSLSKRSSKLQLIKIAAYQNDNSLGLKLESASTPDIGPNKIYAKNETNKPEWCTVKHHSGPNVIKLFLSVNYGF